MNCIDLAPCMAVVAAGCTVPGSRIQDRPVGVAVDSKGALLVADDLRRAGYLRSDRAFTSSLSRRTISIVLRMSASPSVLPMVEALASSLALSAR